MPFCRRLVNLRCMTTRVVSVTGPTTSPRSRSCRRRSSSLRSCRDRFAMFSGDSGSRVAAALGQSTGEKSVGWTASQRSHRAFPFVVAFFFLFLCFRRFLDTGQKRQLALSVGSAVAMGET
uniref:Uncharacterized protein n=1 Tax=Ixodes ricinus TaxID=34613 RepID=A0A6B0UMV1_IXORI